MVAKKIVERIVAEMCLQLSFSRSGLILSVQVIKNTDKTVTLGEYIY